MEPAPPYSELPYPHIPQHVGSTAGAAWQQLYLVVSMLITILIALLHTCSSQDLYF